MTDEEKQRLRHGALGGDHVGPECLDLCDEHCGGAVTTLRDQFAIEAFYRLQVTPALRVTPSVQLLFDPALNPDENLVAVFRGDRGDVVKIVERAA